ncbi:MotA/TolQ/ExbB proton channel family protein (plasmid) [Leisingera sp. S132]|uniref:MotA/TolQ/ExbB proton channel family protein n=1 Tax=Leisingera sp. S132 TaxID=2867016 RepID=UPI0021A7DB23|nr:MotA/TolQ/ExbB proton channel family protein [Leisingera sp. S132]UWQ81681.1 MotA/TolQ/ExbB proton channel family protein [Leisingera sp. S132]
MTLRLPAAAAAFLLMASLAAAQETPAIPVPVISADTPAAAGTAPEPSAPIAQPPVAPVPASASPALSTDAGTLAAPPAPQTEAETSASQPELTQMASDASAKALKFLRDGGPSIWAIAALSVITLALILWKIWRLALIGAWSRGKAADAVAAFERGDRAAALAIVQTRIGVRSKVVTAALTATASLPEDRAREETARVAKLHLASAATGLGALELIATIAPLLGLLGTVLGMIAAFQALQAAGSKADPALLAGGIWEALLTTAAGMAVAIPASAALTWFEAVISRIRRDLEDSATRIFVARQPDQLALAAE